MLDKLAAESLGETIWQFAHKERVLRAKSRGVTKSELGDQWPLTIDAVEICNNGVSIFLRANGKLYPVNGVGRKSLLASGEDVGDIHEIWRGDPNLPGSKMNIAPLISLGNELKNTGSHGNTAGARLRLRQAAALNLLLRPILLAANVMTAILLLVSRAIKTPGGNIVKVALVLLVLAITWLTAGIMIKEWCEAIAGFWRQPFSQHGVYFVIAPPVVLFIIVIALMNRSGR